MAAPTLMTVDECLRTPETVVPQELAYGVLRVADSPLPRHQAAVAQLFRALDPHVTMRDLGRVWLAPLDVILDSTKSLVVQPDLFFISNERAWIVRDRVRGAPDLVIEVLSPHLRVGRIEEHVAWFAAYGVRECWHVHQHPRQTTILRFGDRRLAGQRRFDAHEPLVSAVLPEFSASLDEILDRGERGRDSAQV